MIKHALSVGSNLFALAHVAERISAFLLRKCALRHKDADVMDGGGRTIWGGGGGGSCVCFAHSFSVFCFVMSVEIACDI